MAKLLFKLNQVPEDEAQEVRELLDEHRIATYETHAGFWGLGVAAIWLSEPSQETTARELLRTYQAERLARQKALKAQREAAGEQPTLGRKIAQSPLRFTLMLVAIVAVLAFSTLPFVGLIFR